MVIKIIAILIIPQLQFFGLYLASRQSEQDFHQNDYDLLLEHAELTDYNKEVFEYFRMMVVKYNRTQASIKLEVKILTVIDELYGHVKLYKFLNQDFKYTGFELSVSCCNLLKRDLYGLNTIKTQANFTNCPIQPGLYVAPYPYLNFDFTRMPPLIPGGRYKVMSEIFVNQKKNISGNFDIVISIVYKRKTRNNKN